MAAEITKEILCPGCGASVTTHMHTGIRAEEDIELREQALSETLFNWFCPECGSSFQLLYPCLYSDRTHNFMLWMSPEEDTSNIPLENMSSLEKVQKRIVTNGLEMREKILIFENDLDDRAVELVKFAIADVLKDRFDIHVREGYFRVVDRENDRIGFTFLCEGTDTLLHRTTTLDAYTKSLEAVRAYAPANNSGFFRMGFSEARETMARYASTKE